MRIGILGGTFNPIHQGHLLLAEGALQAIPLDRVLWMPTHLPPHKSLEGNTSPFDRFHMLELAIQGNPHFQVSRIELDRPPPSYTIDTIRQLKKDPSFSGAEWYFLLGSDSAKGLPTWRESETLIRLVQFVVIPRPGHPIPPLPEGVRTVQVKTVDLCASEIRKRIHEDRSIEGLVPDPVRQYIEGHRLYR